MVQETTSDPGDRVGSANPARSKVEQRTSEGCPPECAGGPHEVTGNGGPRWMAAERSAARRPGTEPGLQTSPSATGAPARTHRPVRDGSSETPRGRAMRRAARATAAPIAEPRTHPAITSENQCAPR